MKGKVKEIEQREIGLIELTDTREAIASLVDNEKLDLRVFVKTGIYTEATKRGVRFYLFDDNWTEFKKLIDQVDREYQELA